MGSTDLDNIYDLVGSRRFCFVITPYECSEIDLLYYRLKGVIEGTTGLRCIRADDVPGTGETLLMKMHALIERAELIVVEISKPSPNVCYEVGYARALHKVILVICKKETQVPTDLQGLERLEYKDYERGELDRFEAALSKRLVLLIDSDLLVLRMMLVAPKGSPSFILSSPRWRSISNERPPGTQPEERTFGDYLGVVGILYALGALLGKDRLPELLGAQHVVPGLFEHDANFYLIGSSRSNSVTAEAMAALQKDAQRPWQFIPDEEQGKTRLVGWTLDGRWEWTGDHHDPRPREDYGLVLRGPHPLHDGRHVLVMAGARSIGTGAACLAATRPELIKKINNHRRNVDLDDKSRTIWALVRGTPDRRDGHIYEKNVSVEDVGVVT
ncbi:MAG TPA: hypothetical protein VNE39_11950 [Planctomycetota bacterium]|nr:hypothetical protein [Planctomycetota bacterium]